MTPSALVRKARAEAQLSVRALADAAGVAASTVHRIEQGELQPTVATLDRIAQAAGMRLRVEAEPDYGISIVGLSLCIRAAIAESDHSRPVRMAAEFASRFTNADAEARDRMVAAEPPTTGDDRWGAFLGGLAEWLAVRHDRAVPAWSHDPKRYLRRGWWVTPMMSMHAWEYAGTPVSFQMRGVYLHRDSLSNV